MPGIPGTGTGTTVPGDGNGDGVKDSSQADVTSLNFRKTETISTQPDALKTPVTFVADSKGGKQDPDAGSAQVTSFVQKDRPDDIPSTINTPLGLLSFTAKVDTNGSTETFSLYVDKSLDIDGYYKKNLNTGAWVNIATKVTEGDKVRLDFSIQDGGPFDSDGKADGIISDPGAVGKTTTPVTPTCPYDPFRLDTDRDGMPDAIETATGSNTSVSVKDNAIFTNASLWVNQVYRDLYGREGVGDSQAAAMASQISAGTLSRNDALGAIVNGAEFDAHAATVIRLYHAVLGRSPELCGYNYWLGQANANMDAKLMGAHFLASAEYLGNNASLSDSAFIDLIYQNVLKRAPDAPGKAYWLDQLTTGKTDRGGMLYGVAQSQEFRAAMADDVAVDALYLGLQDRAPAAAEVTYWLGEYAKYGTTANFLAKATAVTAEYHDRFMPADGSTEGVAKIVLVGQLDVLG